MDGAVKHMFEEGSLWGLPMTDVSTCVVMFQDF